MIDILLATYNGEKYISEQIESILCQTYQNFRILIRDDGSSDNTVKIIKKYVDEYPQKIVFIEDDKKGGSAAKNFFHLINYANSDYVMFCDQDDYWLPDKVEVTYKSMLKLEKRNSKNTPILVFASYKAVDSKLNPINIKEKNNQIAKYKLDFSHLLVQNYVTGCLMMCNKALYSNCGEYDDKILMHDWWLALLASCLGVVYHVPKKVMYYRQHGNNEVGAVDVKSLKYRIGKFLDKKTKKMQYLYLSQAQLFYKRYKKIIGNETTSQLEHFISIYNEPLKVKRQYQLIKGHYLKSDIVRIVGQLWYV